MADDRSRDGQQRTRFGGFFVAGGKVMFHLISRSFGLKIRPAVLCCPATAPNVGMTVAAKDA